MKSFLLAKCEKICTKREEKFILKCQNLEMKSGKIRKETILSHIKSTKPIERF